MAEEDKDLTVVELAKKRYERAKDYYSDQRELALEDTRFAMGDSDNKWQWPAQVYADRANINKKPCLTINVTAQHCNQIINNIRQNRPSARVLPVDGSADKKTAEILAGMIRSIQSYSSADTAHDLAAEHAIYGGEGYWRVITDYESYDSFNQIILIKPIANPRMVLIDDASKEPDRSDAEWGFIFEDIPKSEVRDEYPDVDMSSWVENPDGWVRQDFIRRAEYFYCTYIDDTLYQLENGAIVLKSVVDKDQGQILGKVIVLPDGSQISIINERPTKRKQWKWCKLLGGSDKPIDEKDWAGSYLPIITVVGKELDVDGQVIRKGIVRDLKDPARMVNYSYSAAVETLALQNKIPYMAAAESIEGHEQYWNAANFENRPYLPFNAWDEEGKQLPMPQRQQGAVMPAAQIQMLQLSTEEMRAASGQQNANFGIKSEAQSGIGIQRLKVQGETATFHFPDNLVRALKYEAKVLIDLIPKVLDVKQLVRVLGIDGQENNALLDPDITEAYLESTSKDLQGIFNPNVGKYDVSIDTGPSFQTQRQEASAAMTEIAAKDPSFMQIAGDVFWRTLDVPGADQLAKRYEKMLPPNLQEEGGDKTVILGQQVQQLSQQLQQAGAALEEMQNVIETLEKEKQAKVIENEARLAETGMKLQAEAEDKETGHMIEAYKAVTERTKVLQPAMTTEALRPLVEDLLIEVLTTPLPTEQEFPDVAPPVGELVEMPAEPEQPPIEG